MVRSRRRLAFLVGCLVCFALPAPVFAGMASPLPTDFQTISRLTETAHGRFQAISFFAITVLVSAATVRFLWNLLQKDFPKLPRLSYQKSIVGVLLWGLLFVIVLAMISGARELMTPGAWKKDGGTYRLAASNVLAPDTDTEADRKGQLERLKARLLQFAEAHGGQFPASDDATDIPRELWEVPEGGGLRYLYVPHLSNAGPATLVVYEPELDRRRRYALLTNGAILCLTSAEIDQFLKREERP
jgi:hypothetical protein